MSGRRHHYEIIGGFLVQLVGDAHLGTLTRFEYDALVSLQLLEPKGIWARNRRDSHSRMVGNPETGDKTSFEDISPLKSASIYQPRPGGLASVRRHSQLIAGCAVRRQTSSKPTSGPPGSAWFNFRIARDTLGTSATECGLCGPLPIDDLGLLSGFCRDSKALLGFTTTYRTAGTAKVGGSISRSCFGPFPFHNFQVEDKNGVQNRHQQQGDECGHAKAPDLRVAQWLPQWAAVQRQWEKSQDGCAH